MSHWRGGGSGIRACPGHPAPSTAAAGGCQRPGPAACRWLNTVEVSLSDTSCEVSQHPWPGGSPETGTEDSPLLCRAILPAHSPMCSSWVLQLRPRGLEDQWLSPLLASLTPSPSSRPAALKQSHRPRRGPSSLEFVLLPAHRGRKRGGRKQPGTTPTAAQKYATTGHVKSWRGGSGHPTAPSCSSGGTGLPSRFTPRSHTVGHMPSHRLTGHSARRGERASQRTQASHQWSPAPHAGGAQKTPFANRTQAQAEACISPSDLSRYVSAPPVELRDREAHGKRRKPGQVPSPRWEGD